MNKYLILLALLFISCSNLHFSKKPNDINSKDMHFIKLFQINNIADTIIKIVKDNYELKMVIDSSIFKTLNADDYKRVIEFIKSKYPFGTLIDSSTSRKSNESALFISTEMFSPESDTIKAPHLFYYRVKLCNGTGCGGIMYEYELIENNGRYNIGKRNDGSYVD